MTINAVRYARLAMAALATFIAAMIDALLRTFARLTHTIAPEPVRSRAWPAIPGQARSAVVAFVRTQEPRHRRARPPPGRAKSARRGPPSRRRQRGDSLR
jgi:hypothetical protein